MKKQRKSYKFLFAFICMVVCFMIPCITSDAATIVDQGVDGDLKWSVDSDGHLLIEGVGDYEGDEDGYPKWLEYQYDITSATVKVSGITNCDFMFWHLQLVKK